jgi:hypothetical protein
MEHALFILIVPTIPGTSYSKAYWHLFITRTVEFIS